MRDVSYHRAAWLGALLAASAPLAAHGAEPYEDTKSRFALRLPTGWKLAPRFGDVFGMTFEKALEASASTALTVHVDPVPAQDLAGFAAAAESAWQSAGAIAVRSSQRAKVAGRPALMRDADQGGRRIRAYFIEDSGHFYHLRFEVPPGLARVVEPDWEAIVASFEPRAGAAPGRGAAAKTDESIPPGLYGVWRGKAGVSLSLRPDRTFAMGGLKGRWSMESGTLVLVVPGRGPLRFGVGLDGDVLELAAPNLETPARYQRAAPEDTTLAGVWKSASGVTLSLGKAGSFEMGELTGTWQEQDERLSLIGEGGEHVTYRFQIEDGRLTLAGGDLESPLVLKRIKK